MTQRTPKGPRNPRFTPRDTEMLGRVDELPSARERQVDRTSYHLYAAPYGAARSRNIAGDSPEIEVLYFVSIENGDKPVGDHEYGPFSRKYPFTIWELEHALSADVASEDGAVEPLADAGYRDMPLVGMYYVYLAKGHPGYTDTRWLMAMLAADDAVLSADIIRVPTQLVTEPAENE